MGLRGNSVKEDRIGVAPQTHPTKFLIDISINSGIIIPMTRVEENRRIDATEPKRNSISRFVSSL